MLVDFGHEGVDKCILQQRGTGGPDANAGIAVRARNGNFCGELILGVIFESRRHTTDNGLPEHCEDIFLSLLVPGKDIKIIEKNLEIAIIIDIFGRDGGIKGKGAARHVKFSIGTEKIIQSRQVHIRQSAIDFISWRGFQQVHLQLEIQCAAPES